MITKMTDDQREDERSLQNHPSETPLICGEHGEGVRSEASERENTHHHHHTETPALTGLVCWPAGRLYPRGMNEKELCPLSPPSPFALVSASSLSVAMSHILFRGQIFLSPSSVSISFPTLPQVFSSKRGASRYLRPRAWMGVKLRMRCQRPSLSTPIP